MNVLHLLSTHKQSALSEQALNLAARLKQKGHTVYFASSRTTTESDLNHRAAEIGLEVWENLYLPKHLNPFGDAADISALPELLKKHEIDIIHCHQRNDHLIAALATAFSDEQPRIVRSFYEIDKIHWRFRTVFLLSKYTDFAFFCFRTVRDSTAGRFILDNSETAVIDYAVDVERFDPARDLPATRDRFGIPDEAFVAGIRADQMSGPNLQVLLDAVPSVVEAVPNFRLLILGELTERQTELLLRNGTQDAAVFAEELSDDEYVAAVAGLDAAIVLEARSLNQIGRIYETMAMGVPITGPGDSLLLEIAQQGRAGIAADPTAESLAEALIALADPERRLPMAEAARERARRDFTVERQAEQVNAVYNQLAKERQDA